MFHAMRYARTYSDTMHAKHYNSAYHRLTLSYCSIHLDLIFTTHDNMKKMKMNLFNSLCIYFPHFMVCTLTSMIFASAPASNSICVISWWPFCDDIISAVPPYCHKWRTSLIIQFCSIRFSCMMAINKKPGTFYVR